MNNITEKMSEYICDNICRHTIGGHTEEGLKEICDNCALINYISQIDEYENKTGQNDKWILCSERMPEERDSIFAKFKGTDKWNNAMFEKMSDNVNATVEFEDGKRTTKTLCTVDGKWNKGDRGIKFKVIAWQPLPEPCREIETVNNSQEAAGI